MAMDPFSCNCYLRSVEKLLNELKKSDKMRGLPNIYSLFRNEFINSILQEHEY